MHTKCRPWRPQLTRAEMGRGWVFFALYLTVFPLSMGWVQRAFHGELPVAEANVVYYLLAATLVFLVFWTFLRHGFDLLLDWLPENLFAFAAGLVGAWAPPGAVPWGKAEETPARSIGAVGAAAGAVGPFREWPQLVQNLLPSGIMRPQF